MADPKRTRAVLGASALGRLIERLRRRVESGKPLTGTVSLRDPSPEERRAVDALLGRRPSKGRTLRVDLETLDALVRHSALAGDLRQALEMVTGPLVNRKAVHADLEARWRGMIADAERVDPRPAVQEWLHDHRTWTLLRRFSERNPERGRKLLRHALEVLGRLPARGVDLAELAAEITGDSHALDAGRPLGTLVIAAAARLGGLDFWQNAEARRDVWASVGVSRDDVSASVLVLGLHTRGNGLLDRLFADHAEAGEPCRLTTGQLLRHPPTFDIARLGTVSICENPSVVTAAARRLGRRSAPLICGDGQPTLAVHALLQQLLAVGVPLRYHGDFDWRGISIARHLMERHGDDSNDTALQGIQPWRFRAEDYLASGGEQPLKGDPTATPWDPSLEAAMCEKGVAVYEEQVLDTLLQDLEW